MQHFIPVQDRKDPHVHRLSVDIPIKLYARLKDLCTQTRLSIVYYITNWIEHGLAKEDANAEKRDQFE